MFTVRLLPRSSLQAFALKSFSTRNLGRSKLLCVRPSKNISVLKRWTQTRNDAWRTWEAVQKPRGITGDCTKYFYRSCSFQFLGFTGIFFSNSEWGSTQNVLMIVLHWSKQISRNCTHFLPNTSSTHTVKIFFSLSDDSESIWS